MSLPGIFINYRREDSGGYAQQIYRAIHSYFGAKLVFMDIDTIHSGDDYRAAIHQAIAQSDVFLAVIGRAWLRVTDDKGIPRLSHDADLVRREIAQALEANIHVIPVLVGRAQMPPAEALPDDLKALASRNAHEIPDHFFDQSVRQLIQNMRPYLHGRRPLSRRSVLLATGGCAVAAIGGVTFLELFHRTPPVPAGQNATADETQPNPIETLAEQSAKQPAVIIKQAKEVDSLPVEVSGPWKIDRLDFSSRVVGPQKLRVAWVSRVSIGISWNVIGFAPDRTLFLSDPWTVFAIREGAESWAYKANSVHGLTPGGLIFLQASTPENNDGNFGCFNSRGEGGYLPTRGNLPNGLITLPDDSQAEQLGKCSGGVLTLAGSNTAIPVGGNCSAWGIVKDSRGLLYAGTDRGMLFCFDGSGKVLWKYNAGAEISGAPLFSQGDPVFSVGDHLICVREGNLRWSLPIDFCRLHLADQSGTVFFTSNETPGAADHDGHLLWTLPVRGEPLIIDPEGKLYVRDYFDKFVMCLG